MSKNNPFNKRPKSKSKPKVIAKKRGYYYSSANINKRKEFQKQSNNENNTVNNNINNEDIQNEDFFPKKKNAPSSFNINNDKINNYNNNSSNITTNNTSINTLELYNKNNLLLNFIESERNKYSILLNKLKLLNYSIGNIILKPKIKNFEINKKLIREKEKKEQEEINFNKNISDKIDEALNKANMALDNIRYLGKTKNSKGPMINNNNYNNNINEMNNNNLNTKYNYNEFKKEKEKMNLINLAQKCLDKYVDNIQMNSSNHDEYFITISKQRKLFKDAKEQLQSAKYRLRNSGSFFDEIFRNNIKKNNNKEQVSLTKLSKEIFFKENIFLRIHSFLKSEIFKKLFVKVIYNDNFIENPNINILINNIDNNSLTNNDVYNIFSLWIIIKEINTNLNQIDNNNTGLSFIDKNINEKIFNLNKENNLEQNSLNNYFLKNTIFDVIEKYLLFLNRKNNNSVNFDENQIFTQDYHKLYEIYFKLEQSKISQFIQNNIENNNQGIISNTREELNYFRNIQSIFTNKGKYVCSIINK